MKMRTLKDAERDYDRALADGAAAVEVMDRKLREVRRQLAAIVLAVGGRIEVSHRDILLSADVEIVIAGNQP
jgi:hypothetical protein